MALEPSLPYGQEKAGEKSNWFTVLATEVASSASRTSELQLCTRAFGVLIEVVTNNINNTPTFTPKILVPDAEGGADVSLVSFTTISASGTNMLVVYPGASDMGDEDKVAVLPREWKLELTYAGTDTTHNMDTAVYARYI